PVVIAVLNSVVSLYYYARVVKVMFFDQPAAGDARVSFRLADLGVVSALSLATTFLVVQFGWLLRMVQDAGRVFRGERPVRGGDRWGGRRGALPIYLGVVGALSRATTFLVVQFGWLLRMVQDAGRVFRG